MRNKTFLLLMLYLTFTSLTRAQIAVEANFAAVNENSKSALLCPVIKYGVAFYEGKINIGIGYSADDSYLDDFVYLTSEYRHPIISVNSFVFFVLGGIDIAATSDDHTSILSRDFDDRIFLPTIGTGFSIPIGSLITPTIQVKRSFAGLDIGITLIF